MSGGDGKRLGQELERQAERIEKADRERRSLLAQAGAIGTLGLAMVLPIVGGVYLGRWLDGFVEGYSLRWTLSFMLLGVALGGANAWFLITRR